MSVTRGSGRLVTEGLIYFIDSANHNSYPTTGSILTDLIAKDIGTITNVTIDNGIFNFNGTTSEVAFSAAGSDIATMYAAGASSMAWIRTESDGGGNFGRIYDCGFGVVPQKNHLLYVSGESAGKTKLSMYHLWTGTDISYTTTSTEITLNEWTHVALTYDTDSTTNIPILYVNGKVKAATSAFGSPTGDPDTSAAALMYIGNDEDGSNSFDGDIAMVSLYNRILSANEILQNYNVHKERFGV